MRINGISGPAACPRLNFKGAYLLSGTNTDINKAAKYLNHAKQDYTNISYRKFGTETYSAKLTSYLFVTTGKDVDVYNNFIQNEKRLEQIGKKGKEYLLDNSGYEDELSRKDFETFEEYEEHQRMSEGLNILKIISEKCNFSSPIHHISAKRALTAMNEKKFDFKEGKIIKD